MAEGKCQTDVSLYPLHTDFAHDGQSTPYSTQHHPSELWEIHSTHELADPRHEAGKAEDRQGSYEDKTAIAFLERLFEPFKALNCTAQPETQDRYAQRRDGNQEFCFQLTAFFLQEASPRLEACQV